MKKNLFILIATVSISCSPLNIYREMPEVKAWEPEIQKFGQLDLTETYADNSVLFAGSSSIRLWKSLSEDMEPYPVIQRGYGGARLSDFAVYADRIIYPHKDKISGVVLFIANDISGRDSDKDPKDVLKLFRHTVKIIRKELPSVPVFWIGITPTSSRWQAWPEISEANSLIEKYCEKNRNTYFISTATHFLNENGTPRDELFVSDRLHLNDEGYRIWKRVIKDELDRVLGTVPGMTGLTNPE